MELLSLDSHIADKAIIDGSLCIPQPKLAKMSTVFVKCFGKWMFSKAACKLQLKLMRKMYPKMAYPEELENYYLEDMPRLPLKTLVTIYNTYMASYQLEPAISDSSAEVLYIYGGKEMKCVKKSAELFQQMHPNCTLYEAKGYNHGYLSTYLPLEWMELVTPFLERNEKR